MTADARANARCLIAAINLGNAALVHVSQDGSISGPAVDLASRIAHALGRSTELIGYPDAASILSGAKRSEWDIALIARDPDRAGGLTFSAPYSVVEVAYATKDDGRFLHASEVDAPKVRIASARGTGYDAMLRRSLRHAELVSYASVSESFERFLEGETDCIACVREGLTQSLAKATHARILEGRAGTIEQAVAIAGSAASFLPVINAVVASAVANGELKS